MNSCRNNRVAVLCLLASGAVLGMSCDGAPPSSEPATQPAQPLVKLNWDLSRSNSIKQVGWPMTNGNEVWTIKGPGTLHVKIPDGSEHDVTFNSIEVFREGARLGPIYLRRKIGTVKEVYADATELADDWKIEDREQLEFFHRTNAAPIPGVGNSAYEISNLKFPLTRSVSIQTTYDSSGRLPYQSTMVLGCADIFYLDTVLATRPARSSPDFRWDLSRDSSVKQVGWPDEVKKDEWSIDGPGVAWLKLDGGAGHDVAFRYAYLEREGDRLKSIRFELAKGQLDAVYADAMKLAANFGVTDTKEIREFKENFASRMLPSVASPDNNDKFYADHSDAGLRPSRVIEIWRSWDQMLAVKKPYRAVLRINFDSAGADTPVRRPYAPD